MKIFTLAMARNGRVVIPAAIRAELGIEAGGRLVARVVDGAVIIETIEASMRRAQALVRRYVPAGAPLVDELIAERHEAAKRE